MYINKEWGVGRLDAKRTHKWDYKTKWKWFFD